MYKCSNCGKEFICNKEIPDHSYGFKKGKPFVVMLCNECTNKLTDKEKELLEVNNANS